MLENEEKHWDYTDIPARKWQWFLETDHWIELVVDAKGLTYIGTDWTSQSGGGYMAGFQTFNEFFNDGPLNSMPETITNEVMNYLIAYRKSGGSKLTLRLSIKTPTIKLFAVYLHLDDQPILIEEDNPNWDQSEIVLFEGIMSRGKHQFEFLFRFKDRQQDLYWKADAKYSFTIGKNMTPVLRITIALDEYSSLFLNYDLKE